MFKFLINLFRRKPSPLPLPTPNPTLPPSPDDVIVLVNQERLRRGKTQVIKNPTLTRMASLHAADMAEHHFFSHEGTGWRTFSVRLRNSESGITDAEECIAEYQTTSEQVVTSWMNSPYHSVIILTDRFTEIGVGYSQPYWCLVIGAAP